MSGTSGTIMTTILWDMKGVLLVEFHKHGKTVNTASYSSLLEHLETVIRRKYKGLITRSHSVARQCSTTHCMSDLGSCGQTGIRGLVLSHGLYTTRTQVTQLMPSFRANETNARITEDCLGCWSSVSCSSVADENLWLPYIPAYKSQNLRQNLDLKVGGATYTRVIK